MKTINRMLAVFMAAVLMLGSMSGWVLASEEAALDTGQEEPSSELAVVSEEFPSDTEIPEEAVTDGEPDELDTASELGTWTDSETGEEYEILSSVEDILPEEFTEEEITEGLLEIMEEIAEDTRCSAAKRASTRSSSRLRTTRPCSPRSRNMSRRSWKRPNGRPCSSSSRICPPSSPQPSARRCATRSVSDEPG